MDSSCAFPDTRRSFYGMETGRIDIIGVIIKWIQLDYTVAGDSLGVQTTGISWPLPGGASAPMTW